MSPSSPADSISRVLAGAVVGLSTLVAVVLAATEGGNASASPTAPQPSPSSSSSPGLAPTAAPTEPADCIEQLEPDFPYPPGSRRTTITTDSRATKAFGSTVRADLEPVRAFYASELPARGIQWAPLGSDSPIGTGSWFGGLEATDLEFGCYLNLSDNDATGNGRPGTVQISVELR